jgi:hypothetical protein
MGAGEVDQALDALLAATPGGGPDLAPAEIERLLTEGYAQALELEVERHRLVSEIDHLLDERDNPVTASEIAVRRADLEALGASLRSLRSRLHEANRRYRSRVRFTDEPG